MLLKDELSIVIPCKNEIHYLPEVLRLISTQENIKGVRVIIADAHSTDGTRAYIENASKDLKDTLQIEMIAGGKVAAARNSGLALVATKYVLFLDADALLTHPRQILTAVEKIDRKDLDLIAAPIQGREKWSLYHLIFQCFNWINYAMGYIQPFAIGNFFLTKTSVVKALGGFDEKAIHAEDFLLSKKYSVHKFGFAKYPIIQDGRRFKKTGYLKMMGISILSFFMQWRKDFFYKDVGYWGKG